MCCINDIAQGSARESDKRKEHSMGKAREKVLKSMHCSVFTSCFVLQL